MFLLRDRRFFREGFSVKACLHPVLNTLGSICLSLRGAERIVLEYVQGKLRFHSEAKSRHRGKPSAAFDYLYVIGKFPDMQPTSIVNAFGSLIRKQRGQTDLVFMLRA